jgi:hypothetical protein
MVGVALTEEEKYFELRKIHREHAQELKMTIANGNFDRKRLIEEVRGWRERQGELDRVRRGIMTAH